ncbi:MAG: VOC family protein [Oscillospiraceae bacterium]|nr:VOC family protein [Oscillospiraceae bacterium]
MKIEHIAVYYNDLERARDFFAEYFGARSGALYHNPKTGFRSYFLTFESGARLEIMSRPDTAEGDKTRISTGYAHIAFSTGSRENVNALTERLRKDGYAVTSEPRTTGDGYYESCIADFEGNIIEITI